VNASWFYLLLFQEVNASWFYLLLFQEHMDPFHFHTSICWINKMDHPTKQYNNFF